MFSSHRLPPRIVVHAVLWLRRVLQRLADALAPPELVLFERIGAVTTTQLLHGASVLRIAELLEGDAKDAETLARLTGTNQDALSRMMRALVARDVFAVDAAGRFRTSRLSRPLVRGRARSVAAFAAYFGSTANVRAWASFLETVKTGENAFERVHGTDVWRYLGTNPAEGHTFAEAMAELTELAAPELARAYPFGRFARVCDVGGGRGALLAAILHRYADVQALLFDVPDLTEQAGTYLERAGVSGQVDVVRGSFFEFVPPGVDAYILKDVLHDWDDEACRRILRNCRNAAAAGTHLLIAETLVESAERSSTETFMDLQMMTVCPGGRQRTLHELRSLLDASGFSFVRAHPTKVFLSWIEAVAR